MRCESRLKQKQGQTTSEYMIGMTLIAVAVIGLVAAYGSELRMKMATVTGALGGGKISYEESQVLESVIGYEASERARRSVNMKGGEGEELEYGISRD